MIKKIALLILFIFFLAGCTSLQFPAYIQDKNPYTQKFYAGHDEVVTAVKKSLTDLGWQVDGTADPTTYEQQRVPEPDSEDVLIYTQVRQTPMFVWTAYRRVNVIVHSKSNTSDVEIRYSKVNAFPFKQFKGYRNDKLAKRIFQHITDDLNQL